MSASMFSTAFLLSALLLGSTNAALGQNRALTHECLASVATEEDRSACARLDQCSSECGANDSCLLSCTAPSGSVNLPTPAAPIRRRPPLAPLPLTPTDRPANCRELLAYRDGDLENDLRAATRRFDLSKQEAESYIETARGTLNLMNEQWLVGETGTEIAIQLKFFADEASAFLHLLAPGEHAVVDLVERSGVTLGILRSAVENGARAASEEASKEAFWSLSEELSPLIAMQHGSVSYADNEAGMDGYKAEVQRQVAALVKSARRWQDKETEARSESQSIAQLKQRITAFCSSSLPVKPD